LVAPLSAYQLHKLPLHVSLYKVHISLSNLLASSNRAISSFLDIMGGIPFLDADTVMSYAALLSTYRKSQKLYRPEIDVLSSLS
jgi:hypothetical protein